MDSQTLRDDVAFFVDGIPYTWGDVEGDARARGEIGALEYETALGVFCEQRATAYGRQLDPAALEAASRRFRYDRNLERAADMEAWLERWHISVDEWRQDLRRDLLRRATAGKEELPREVSLASDVGDAVLLHAVCSGTLERWAEAFAMRVAAAATVAPVPANHSEADISERYEAFRSRVVTDHTLADEIGARRLDWVRVRYRLAQFPNIGAAKEAALCIRDDGMSLADVAAEARMSLVDETNYLEEIEPTLRARLLGAQVGELIGPYASGKEFTLCELVGKSFPSREDDAVRSRAERVLIERSAALEAQQRVRWARGR